MDFSEVFSRSICKKVLASVLFHQADTSVKFRRLFNCPIKVLIDTQTNIYDDIYPLLDFNSVCGDRRSVAPRACLHGTKGNQLLKQ